MKIYKNVFEKIISPENLFSAWDKFQSDKKKKRDICEFEWELEKNIFQLHRDLKNKQYKHGAYTSFYIQDPKQRHIHKATVRDRVQMLLGREDKPRPKHHEFAFTGSMRCGVCGCLYTAETKQKLLKSGEIRKHTYYHCTRKTTKIKCNQRKNIPVDDLEVLIEKEIEKYTILPEFLQWALEGLNKKNDTEIEDRTKVYEMRHKNLVETQKELDELTKMRYRQLIDDETFIREKNTLQSKVAQMKENLRETETRAEKWLELTEKTFAFATYARAAFLRANKMGKAGLELKKEILLAIGKVPIITDQKLFIEPNEWFAEIQNGYPALETKYKRLELTKMPMNKAQKDALASVRAHWLPSLDVFRTPVWKQIIQEFEWLKLPVASPIATI